MSKSVSRALVFPGLGTQSVGMGRDLFERFPVAAAEILSIEKALEGVGVFQLSRVMFEDPIRLAQPIYSKAALVALGRAYAETLGALIPGFMNDVDVTGHSYGFVTAANVADVISRESTVRLILAGSEVLATNQDIKAGAMLAIIGRDVSPESIRLAIDELGATSCVVGNDNGPGQVVVAGLKADLQILIEAAPIYRWKCASVNDGIPAHSHHLQPVEDALRPILMNDKSVRLPSQGIRLVDSQTARQLGTVEEIKLALATNFTGPVLWQDTIRHLEQTTEGRLREYVVFGPVVGGLIRRINPAASVTVISDAAALEKYIDGFRRGGEAMLGVATPPAPIAIDSKVLHAPQVII